MFSSKLKLDDIAILIIDKFKKKTNSNVNNSELINIEFKISYYIKTIDRMK